MKQEYIINENIKYLTNILSKKHNIPSEISCLNNQELLKKFGNEENLYELKQEYTGLIYRIKKRPLYTFTSGILNLDYKPLIEKLKKNDRKTALKASITGLINFIKKPEMKDKLTLNDLITKTIDTNTYYHLINQENIQALINAVMKTEFITHKNQYTVIYGFITYELVKKSL